jgi:hypothetical protein
MFRVVRYCLRLMRVPGWRRHPARDHLPLPETLATASLRRRAELTARLVERHGRTVMTGPFAGMSLPEEAAWGDGDLAPKLLGCYEAELHPAIAKAIERQPVAVINVGGAEGYYAVGLARALPKAEVHVFDISTKAQAICRKACEANGVSDRMIIEGAATFAKLRKALNENGRTLLVIDCEGAELKFMDLSSLPELRSCDVIVECHDFLNATITETLQTRFKATHEVECIVEGARNPNIYPPLQRMSSLDRWLMVNEGRPETMNWLVCWAH